jgi:hypothetical protein
MDFKIEIEPDTGWGSITISGDIRSEELLDFFVRVWGDPEYLRVDRAKWRFCNARTDMRVEDVMRMTKWVSENKLGRGPRFVALVASDDLIFGMSRMFEALLFQYGGTMSVFRTDEAANAWLGQQQ